MSVPERLRILAQSASRKIAGLLKIPDHFIFLTWSTKIVGNISRESIEMYLAIERIGLVGEQNSRYGSAIHDRAWRRQQHLLSPWKQQ